ncbi:YncE family protein [Clostridium paridis]|uniref:YncE family protein n=1 Tax=Clostridium paridis TaxID=2803863 RepID=A0A937FIP3_9CLOT|nr:YncE family protein [Clostridium paridis]MBL4933820.1 YncE family protein [Clostridium paridis]
MFKLKYTKIIGVFIIISLILTACNKTNENNNESTNKNEKNKVSYLYTANESGSISEIDLSTYKITESVKDPGAPHNIQVSPDGSVVGYTSSAKMEKGQTDQGSMSENGYAIFYETETGKLIKKVEVGKHPAHVVFTNDGKKVLVTNNEDNNVSILDSKNYSLIKNVAVGKGPHGFRISSDSQFAYIANMGEDTVSIVDINNNKEIRKIKVGSTPVTTGVTKDGKTLVVTINGENAIGIIDLSTDKVEKVPVGVGPAQLYLSADDKFVFVANQGTEEAPSNSVTKIDLAAKKVAATIQTGKGSHGVLVSPDNKFVYVTNMYESTVSIIDYSTNKVIQTITVDGEPNGISIKE